MALRLPSHFFPVSLLQINSFSSFSRDSQNLELWPVVNMKANRLLLSYVAEGQTTVTLWRRETRIDCLGLRRRGAARLRHHRNRQLFSPRKRHGEAERARNPFLREATPERAGGRLQGKNADADGRLMNF